MNVHVVDADWHSQQAELMAIRRAVFIDEQKVPEAIEWDGQDDRARHFLAINQAGQRIGCARLLPDGQIGRMAVLAHERRKGVGGQLLEAALEAARELGLTQVFLNAQRPAVDFYHKAGFLPEGDEFSEAGIPHQRMTLALPIPFEAPGEVAKPVIREESPPAAAAAAELTQHEGEGACVEALLTALSWPLRTVRIYSQTLDHQLFDRPDVTDALSAFVRSGPPTRLLVLIHSSGSIVSRGHQLVELARRLNSKIEIRTVPTELAVDRHSCVISDEQGYLLLPDHETYQAIANRYDPVQAQRLADRFDYLWERSATDPELRVLRL
ncbi:MAG: GNAT family N-acetyltransferase [Pseudomonadales bacterium]|jgi:predicted GNAT family N-acyltransferase